MSHTDLVQSVTRSLEILEIIAHSEEGVTLHELARRLGVASPTAHNLARTLQARGYVEKSSRPTRYHLGPAIFELVHAQQHRTFLHTAADIIRTLAADFPAATVTVTQARGTELHVVLRMSPERPGLLQRPEAMVMNAYLSAHGLVYQTFWTAAERLRYRRRYSFEEFGAHAWPSLAHLDTAIAEVRNGGYARLATDGHALFRVAVPIFNASHSLIASLGISLPLTHLDTGAQEAICAAMLTAAHRMTPTDPFSIPEDNVC